MNEDSIKKLNIEQKVLANEIEDLLYENDIAHSMFTINEIDALTNKIEAMRTRFRGIHVELQWNMDEEHYEPLSKNHEKTLSLIRNYIRDLKLNRQHLRNEESLRMRQNEVSAKTSQAFLIKEISNIIVPLRKIFITDPRSFTFDELSEAKTELPTQLRTLKTLSNMVRDMLAIERPDQCNAELDSVVKEYHELCAIKQKYVDNLQVEVRNNEVTKQGTFQSAKLNIKLAKFKGYDSVIDIYNFQSDFEKLHKKTTPNSLLPDLLKNNYLEGSALTLVKGVDSIEEIWKRLKASYGDPKLLLSKKLTQLDTTSRLWRSRDPEKQIDSLSKILNFMRDTMRLALQHNIQERLYYSDTIERIYSLLDDVRINKWFTTLEEEEEQIDEPAVWKKLTVFLEKEVSIQQRKLLHCSSGDSTTQKSTPGNRSHSTHLTNYSSGIDHSPPTNHSPATNYLPTTNNQEKCFICGEMGHTLTNGPRGMKLIQYFSCRQFTQMTPAQRFNILRQKGLCYQCLFPGADQSKGKHQEGRCQRDFVCPHPSHDRYTCRKHVLVCQDHASNQENSRTLQLYKERCINRQAELPTYSKDIKLTFHTNIQSSFLSTSNSTNQLHDSQPGEPIINNRAIFILQTVEIDHKPYTIFFDLGCSDMVIRKEAVSNLNHRCQLEFGGEVTVGGVGQSTQISNLGIYKVKLPLHNGCDATLSGVCLPQITSTFPVYPLQKVGEDIQESYRQHGNDPSKLPSLATFAGGEIDIMLGIKYLRYHPKPIFQLPSGLTIYESMFSNADGGRGVVGGPHEVFNNISKFNGSQEALKTFVINQYKIYQTGILSNPDVSLLHIKTDKDHHNELLYNQNQHEDALLSRNQKIFEQAEEVGSTITYRCMKCRGCQECKSNENFELVSIKEEVEQHLINQTVTVDLANRVSWATLPLMHNPEIKLAPNKDRALKVYYQQLKKLNKEPKDKSDVIISEGKLQSMGYVDYVRNLTADQQQTLNATTIKNFIPWRAVWNGNSLSTPCRLVFDASQPTSSGYSLNSILAKGTNNMNRLVEILIRWTSHQIAFHTDIRKMYNTVKLKESHWCLQRYIWQEELDFSKLPEEKVIKTLIYGVKSSGNQSERALRETSRLSKDEYPGVYNVIQNDVYVDDCLSGADSTETAIQCADQLEIVLNKGGFALKGVTFSSQQPNADLTSDGESINVAGMKWYPKQDQISLDISELNFAKKSRGKKPASTCQVPINLTRRHCVAKVAELYDITGKITPITAAMKLDLHQLVERKLDWDDKIPDDLRHVWDTHFQMMEEVSSIHYQRAVIPPDAESLEIDTIDAGDASKDIACVAIYARFKRKSSGYSCQLVFSRSRLVPSGMTQPRAELFAATLNAHTGEVVKRSFKSLHQSALKLSDSQIALFWINGDNKQLKSWVRNRVIEIQRFTKPSDWKFVSSQNMIADIGTRRGASINDVNQDSIWFNGFPWMKESIPSFPVKSIKDITLNQDDATCAKKEHITIDPDSLNLPTSYIADSTSMVQTKELYQFSNYIIDPNKFTWSKVIKVLSNVLQFIYNSRKYPVTFDATKQAEHYFFVKATEEIKSLIHTKKYTKISYENNGILYYNGRILPDSSITSTGRMTAVMLDLSFTMFCVPLVHRHSPIAYSIVNHVHWNHSVAKHSGVETVLRYVLKIAYIIDGRELVRLIRRRCEKCRYIAKKTIEVEMGPTSKHNLNIAPPFYSTQVDLCGPFNAYSNFNKRTTVKIWLVVFCCTTTSATKIKVMDDYSSSSFILSFTRFASDVGFPRYLLPDEGSQLVKSCQDLRLNFKNIQNRLFCDVQVEFDVCPVSGHHMHGKVERKIREIKKSLSINLHNERLSVLHWETIASQIASTINDVPLAVQGLTDFEVMDVLTPNRLLLGRNNERSPTFPVTVTSNPGNLLKANQKIFDTWFETWLTVHVPKLMYQPKWFDSHHHIKIGDVVLFIKRESTLNNTYQYGKVKEIISSQDGRIRKVIVEYRNENENTNRTTYRAVRGLVLIHPVDELSLSEELAMANCMG